MIPYYDEIMNHDYIGSLGCIPNEPKSGEDQSETVKFLKGMLENAPENITEDDTFKLIREILHHKYYTHHMTGGSIDNYDLLENLFCQFNLSKKITLLCYENCILSASLFTHIIKQLFGLII